MALTFSAKTRKRLYAKLQSYVKDEFDEEIGDLRADRMFEFMVGLIGAAAYNQAISDAQAYIQGRLIDMEIELEERGDTE